MSQEWKKIIKNATQILMALWIQICIIASIVLNY